MKIALNTAPRKGLAAATFAVIALGYLGLAVTQFAASWEASQPDVKSLERAASLDPGNAEYRHDLGRYYDLVVHDQNSALRYYKEAVELNPHSARYWFALASTYGVMGDTSSQTTALEHAIQADPMTPDVAWEAGNLYLVQGENEKALREFRVVIANDSDLAYSALQFSWRIEPDVDALLRDVIPAQADADLSFLRLLETKQDTAGAAKVWSALMNTSEPFERRWAYDYIRYLLEHKEADQAALVWQQTAGRLNLSSYLPSSANLIVNPTFSLSILNAGFDWQYQKQTSVTLTLDPNEFHAGRRSLMITFDGPGISDAGIVQFVNVQPNTAYDFAAYYKNGEIDGAGGPHFTIQDMYTQAVYFESEELKNATFWKSVNGEFTTGTDCKLIVLHIRRLPAGSPIRGKLWVDDFHLTQKSS